MNLYILPVSRILLEYVLKLGDMIFFPGNISEDDIEHRIPLAYKGAGSHHLPTGAL